MAGRAARRPNARGVSPDRHGAAVRTQRIFVVLHLDRAAAVLLSERGVAAAHRAAVSLLQDLDQLQSARRLAVRSLLSVALLRAVLCIIGVGDSAGKTYKINQKKI